jgi:hypothetical protein
MAIDAYQIIYKGEIITGAQIVIGIDAPRAGALQKVHIKAKTANPNGDTEFNVSVNGTDVFTEENRPVLLQNETIVSVDLNGVGLDTPTLNLFDEVVLHSVIVPTGGITSPIAFQIDVNSALALDGTVAGDSNANYLNQIGGIPFEGFETLEDGQTLQFNAADNVLRFADPAGDGASLPAGDLNAALNKLEKIFGFPIDIPENISALAGYVIGVNDSATGFELREVEGGTVAPMPPLEFPADLPWFTAYEAWRDDETVDGDPVATVADQSGNDRDATQITSGNRPIFVKNDSSDVLNNRAFYNFEDTVRFFDLPDMSALTQGESFYVVKSNSESIDSVSGLHHTGSDAENSHYPYSGGTVYDTYGSNGRKSFDPVADLSLWHVANFLSKSGEWYYNYLNGDVSWNYGTASNAVSFTSTPRWGKSFGVGYLGRSAAAYHFTRKLTSDERAVLLAYISNVFGFGNLE